MLHFLICNRTSLAWHEHAQRSQKEFLTQKPIRQLDFEMVSADLYVSFFFLILRFFWGGHALTKINNTTVCG